MLSRKKILTPFSLIFIVIQGCSHSPPAVVQPTEQQAMATLSDEISETSGLACLSGQRFLTVNDSGNAPVVYQLDTQGRILARLNVNADNKDWEAITIHQGQLWIADIGNNSGQRPSIQLLQSDLPTFSTQQLNTRPLQLRYATAPLPQGADYQHNLDAEALVSTGDELLLFSKNWLGNQSTVYSVNTTAPNSVLSPSGQTAVLPGVITDVAFSAEQNVFVVAGYQNFRQNPLQLMLTGNFEPFLAVLDRQYQLQAIVPISTGGQLEAVCVDEQQQIWLSQEKSRHQPALFWRWGTVETLIGTKN